MLTTTERFTSTNGKPTNGKPFPMNEPAGDSAVLLIPVGPNFKPNGATSTPGERSLKMPRDIANQTAVELNRKLLSERDVHQQWHVVLYSSSGFHVLKIEVPISWKPEDEYSLPPTFISDSMNCEARREVKAINKVALLSGEPIKKWAIHVKPLQPVDEVATLPTEKHDKPAEIKLDDRQRKILAILKNCTNGMTDVEERAGGILYRLTGTCGLVHSDQPDSDIISSLRSVAGSLLDAANHIEGSPTPQLYSTCPASRVVHMNGFEDVDFQVVNCEDDEQAFQKVRQMLSTVRR